MGQKVIVVTGGSKGIGYAITRQLLQSDYQVVMVSRDEQRLREAASQLGDGVSWYRTDVTDRSSVEETFQRLYAERGPVYGVVNNAGLPILGGFLNTDPDEWKKGVELHVHGTYLVAWHAARQMKETGTGRIINLSSAAGLNPPPGLPLYAGAKGAVLALTKALAVELAPHGITVNAICPGPVDTDTFRQATPPDVYRERTWSIPTGRFIQPEEIASACAFLCSDGAASMTGEFLLVDGGAAAVGPYAVNLFRQHQANSGRPQ